MAETGFMNPLLCLACFLGGRREAHLRSDRAQLSPFFRRPFDIQCKIYNLRHQPFDT